LKINELDVLEELTVRREIAVNGKSRAFINDTPVNLSQMQELGLLLVDLHRQFDTLELGESGFQRQVLDALAGHAELVQEYREKFNRWKMLSKETEDLKAQQLQLEKETDYNRFQFNELEEAGFRENELEEAEAELKILSNAEGIRSALDKALFELKESETPLIQQLKVLLNQLGSYSSYHPALPEILQRMQSAQVELQDVAGDIIRISNHIHYDPEKIEKLNERLSLGYKLQKKHGVNSTAELIEIKNQLEEKLQAVQNLNEVIRKKEKETQLINVEAEKLAAKISAGRLKQIKPLEEKVNKLLAQVGMPNARLKAEVKEEKELNAYGNNSIEFLFNANISAAAKEEKTGQFAPIRKVASGGELSRLMLCIKSLVAQSVHLPVLIFDEIDSGISGEAARQVGIIMKDLAARMQVICITHQPQIAGKADAHYFVYKEIAGKKVQTGIRLLNDDERITTIAQMLSGEKPTAAALANAREMIMN
jgi:DNA repair protein RecN (Recombination protein N)